jgi:hypothetical protein
MCYSISISFKYLVSEWPETQRLWLVNCPGLEVFVIRIVKLLIICNGDTIVNPLSPELNPICYMLALLDYDFLYVSMINH